MVNMGSLSEWINSIGVQKGRKQASATFAKKMQAKGYNMNTIAEILNVSVAQVEEWLKEPHVQNAAQSWRRTTMDESKPVTVTFEVDEGLLTEAEQVLAVQGFTLEGAIVSFFRWCAYSPDEAKATIKSWASKTK